MECFDQLPPVVAFVIEDAWDDAGNLIDEEGYHYLLADGFHRCKAAKRLGRESIGVVIEGGTRKYAEAYAAMSNAKTGLPLTRAERRVGVERILKSYPNWSGRRIAAEMGVSKNTVAKYREELKSGGQIDHVDKIIGKDGKEYPHTVPHQKQKGTNKKPERIAQEELEPKEGIDPQPSEKTSEKSTEAESPGELAEDEVETDESNAPILPSDFSIAWASLMEASNKVFAYDVADIAKELLRKKGVRSDVSKMKGFFNALSEMMKRASDEGWWERG